MKTWFEDLCFNEFILVLVASNIAMYVGSWVVVLLLQRGLSKHLLNVNQAVVSRNDYVLSIFIVIINISVGVPGWLLWKNDFIILADNGLFLNVFDTLLIVMYFDFAMYFLHRLMHVGWLYRLFHRRHHDHVDVNGISLYVMNPLEAAGFGVLLIAFLAIRDFSFHALFVFLFLNWCYGTMAHSGVPVNNRLLSWCVGDSAFHHEHHSALSGNFGFYTGIWDRVFGTFVKRKI